MLLIWRKSTFNLSNTHAEALAQNSATSSVSPSTRVLRKIIKIIRHNWVNKFMDQVYSKKTLLIFILD